MATSLAYATDNRIRETPECSLGHALAVVLLEVVNSVA